MKLKKSQTNDTVGANPAQGGAFLSSRHRNPAEELALHGSGSGGKVGGICALIATIMLAAISFLLYMQLSA